MSEGNERDPSQRRQNVRRGRSAWWRGAALAALLLTTLSTEPFAHEIPSRVRVLAFVKPDGQRLRLLVRVPFEALRDLDIPMKGLEYLDLVRVQPLLEGAARTWIADYVELRENDRVLPAPRIAATRISLPSDRSFERYDAALAHATGPSLPAETELPWRQAMFDVLLEYDITSERSRFSMRPLLAHLGLSTTTVLRFLPAGGTERAFQWTGDPGLVRLDPRWHQAALRFVSLGVEHILGGIDHLLFVLCLVIPFRRIRPLVAIVTAFTVAHSITLIASALGLAPDALWFPPLIEALIALSIVYMAFENIVGPKLRRRWILAFAFGLVHGFGFSFALRDSLQFAGAHLMTSLLSFNVGVELGQLVVIAVSIPVLSAIFRYVAAERIATIILSALVAHTAWHWMTDRLSVLREYQLQWPVFDRTMLPALMRGLMLLLILIGVLWGLTVVFGKLLKGGRGTTDSHASVGVGD